MTAGIALSRLLPLAGGAAATALALGTVPARAAAPRPAVVSFGVAPGSLPSAGGTIQLMAEVRGARRCTFRGQETPRGAARVVRTVACSGGRATTLVSVGPNTRTSRQTLRFSVTAADDHGRRAVRTISLLEAAAPPALVVPSVILTAATVGQPYSAALTAHGGTPGYTWSVTAGGLPAGLTLSPGGQITGTPTAPGGSSFTVSVTDVGSPDDQTATATLSLPVGGGSPIATTPQETYYQDNWSGYAEFGTFTGVTGTFTVPSLAGSTTAATVTEWVGVDGARPTDASVLQAGVDESWTPGASAATVTAWWEIWPAAGHDLPIPVAPGDRVSVTIGAVNGGNWRIQLSDLTTGQAFSTDQPYNGPASSAEWIVETPKDLATNTLLSLAHYSSPVAFTNLFTAGSATSLEEFTMVGGDGSQVVSVPSGISGAGFAVGYGASPPPAP